MCACKQKSPRSCADCLAHLVGLARTSLLVGEKAAAEGNRKLLELCTHDMTLYCRVANFFGLLDEFLAQVQEAAP